MRDSCAWGETALKNVKHDISALPLLARTLAITATNPCQVVQAASPLQRLHLLHHLYPASLRLSTISLSVIANPESAKVRTTCPAVSATDG